jgi:uncharacterized membrane protein
MVTTSNSDQKRAAWHWVLFGVAITLTVFWLFLTPHGLLGKADAVGYAVCHQIKARSFQINGRSFPLCARCSGLFLGALLGLTYQVIRGWKGRMPPLGASLFFGLLAFTWVFDGFNSFLMLVPSVSSHLHNAELDAFGHRDWDGPGGFCDPDAGFHPNHVPHLGRPICF